MPQRCEHRGSCQSCNVYEKSLREEVRHEKNAKLCSSYINEHDTGINTLMVQASALFLTVSPFVLSFGADNLDIPVYVRILIFLGWISLIMSLSTGVVDKVVKQRFWEKYGKLADTSKRIWKEVREGECTDKSAEKILSYLLPEGSVNSPIWPKVTQMILLFLGVCLEFIAYAFILFQVAGHAS